MGIKYTHDGDFSYLFSPEDVMKWAFENPTNSNRFPTLGLEENQSIIRQFADRPDGFYRGAGPAAELNGLRGLHIPRGDFIISDGKNAYSSIVEDLVPVRQIGLGEGEAYVHGDWAIASPGVEVSRDPSIAHRYSLNPYTRALLNLSNNTFDSERVNYVVGSTIKGWYDDGMLMHTDPNDLNIPAMIANNFGLKYSGPGGAVPRTSQYQFKDIVTQMPDGILGNLPRPEDRTAPAVNAMVGGYQYVMHPHDLYGRYPHGGADFVMWPEQGRDAWIRSMAGNWHTNHME